jgi:class 3 adenylate cyclase/YHS domain-containing protein
MERERAFLFADLAGFTALTEAHGDVDAADIAERFYHLAGVALVGDARIVKTIGDAVMIVADDAGHAVSAALALRSAVAAEPSFPLLRCGLHAGTVVERRGDFIGGAVNLAARVAAHATAGQILGTDVVAEAARRAGITDVAGLGAVALKNIAEPVQLYAIAESRTPCIDPVCRMSVTPTTAAAQVTVGARTIYFCSRACASAFEASLARGH